jgi:hypothetical protein
MGGACSSHWGDKFINILVGKPEEKKPLRRPRRRWEDNIRMDLKEIAWEVMNFVHLAQNGIQ